MTNTLEQRKGEIADKIAVYYADQRAKGGEIEIEVCPFCQDGRKKCAFNQTKGVFNCFICGGHSLWALAEKLGIWQKGVFVPRTQWHAPPTPIAPPKEEKPAVDWMSYADEWVDYYASDPSLISHWTAYKPLSAEIITANKLGYGPLPGQKTPRLVVPLYDFSGRRVTGLHGRLPSGSPSLGAKWICAEGSSKAAYGMHRVSAGAVLYICENYIDALMHGHRVEQRGNHRTIALGSARRLNEAELAYLDANRPQSVIVCLDNDLSGQATGKMKTKLMREWVSDFKAKHPGAPVPKRTQFGPEIVMQLRKLGIESAAYVWPDDAPAKADLGWLLDYIV